MPRFDIVVFDFDGTIANTLPLIYHSFNTVLQPRIGRALPEAEIRSHFGPPDNVILANYLDAGDVATAFDEYIAIYEARHNDFVHLFEGIREIVAELREAGTRVGVMTGKSRVSALISFRELGISDLIEVLVAGDDVAMPKPHPEGVIDVLEQLGFTAGQTAVMVGDSAADIYAGRGAGTSTIGVLWGVPDHEDLFASGPDVVVEATAQLRTELGLQ